MINKTILLAALVISMNRAGYAQKVIQLFDGDSVNKIPFELKAGNLVFRSDNDGKLILTRTDSSRIANQVCSIQFSDELDNIIYRNKLYFKTGTSKKDRNASFTDLHIKTLLPNKINTFFLRYKDDAVDEEA